MLSMARVAAALLAVMLGFAVLFASGCSAPEYTYVKNTTHKTYFKVPASWRVIDEDALKQITSADSSGSGNSTATPADNGSWAVAYDAAEVPSPTHLVDSDTSEPIVYASVQPVPETSPEKLSLDSLRDLLLPVTAMARSGQTGESSTFSDFTLVTDTVLTPEPGLRGVHEVFQYRLRGGPLQTFDQTAYVNDEASKVYVMLLRCSSECYQARRAELESVAASFTVQEGS
jgi:hypothetical protein